VRIRQANPGASQQREDEFVMESGKVPQRIYRWIGVAALALSVVYFVGFALRNAGSLPRLTWDPPTAAGLAGAVLVYLLVVLLAGLNWLIFLRAVGETGRPRTSLPIFAIAQFGKYIPGNVAHLAGRVVLAVQAGLAQERVLASMALEIAWLVLSSAFIAGAALSLSARTGLAAEVAPLSGILLVVLAISALLVPVVGAVFLRHLPQRLRELVPGLTQIQSPGAWPLVGSFILGCLNMLLLSAIIVLLDTTVFDGAGRGYLAATGVFALAWLAGFVTPGAPAGLGVRDAILITGLTPVYGAGTALGLTVLLRLVTSAGDGIAFLVGLAFRSATSPRSGR
jgi:hypothetical protein